jgi:hypothetical protein
MHRSLRAALGAPAVAGLLLVALMLGGCGFALQGTGGRPSATCTPPAGGRCAADVAWPGHILVTPDGRRLHGRVPCGGTLSLVAQTSSRVTIRLHVGAMGPGTMSCALPDVGVRLDAPLRGRTVYDAVSGRSVPVEVARACPGVALRCPR